MSNFITVILYVILTAATAMAADYRQPLTIKTKNAGNIPFSHENHLKNLNNNCSACHNSIYHIVRKNNPVVTMAEMENGKSCGACHNKSNPKNPQLSNCSLCHSADAVQITINDFGSVLFMHSKHLGMFTCTDCHDSIFKTDKSNAHITMQLMKTGKSCGACHDGKTAFSVAGDCVKCHQAGVVTLPGNSTFSHPLHLDMSFNCSDCHNKIFTPGLNRVSYSMTDMEKGKSCGACHDGKAAFSVKADCQKCHKSVKDISFKAFGARFSHTFHLNMFTCNDCHSGVFTGGAKSFRYTMQQMESGKSCGSCHDGKTAFNVSGSCDKCHTSIPGDISFKIKDSGIVAFSHQKHRSKFSCDKCHNSIIKAGASAKRFTMAEMTKGSSCGACHDGKFAFSTSMCSKCHPVKEILFTDDARFSHDKHLSSFSCTDCHSQLYSVSGDNKRFSMTQMEKGASCGSCHDGSTAFTVKGSCDKCHKSTVSINFKVKETGVTTFSHSIHKNMYSCVDCHSSIFKAGKERLPASMADMEKGRSCGTCHDGKTAFSVKNDCQKCHVVKQIQFRPGSAEFSHTIHLSMYSCKDCHPALFIPGPGNKRFTMNQMEKGSSCGSCHDGSTAFSVKGDCQKCHKGQPKTVRYELSPSTGNVEFSHKPHTDRGYNCSDCHYSVVPTGTPDKRWVMKEMDQGKFCGTCHGFSMAFSVKDPLSCERCHQKESDWRPQQLQ